MSSLLRQRESEGGIEDKPASIRVLIADDHPLLIAGIRRALEHFDDIEVVGEAHSGPELLALTERRRPSVVLMDLRMPGVLGVEGVEQLHSADPSLKLVVLSACDDRPTIDAALRAGASAYVLKRAESFDLASVLRQASSGAVFHAPTCRPAACAGVADEPELPSLTDREQSILSAIASGSTTTAISQELWVSEHTIKFHLTNIYRKLGVRNRASAVRYAIERGLVGS